MADVNANIGINIDATSALAQLKNLQREISQFHTSIAKSSEAAALAQANLQKNFLTSINATGAFSAELRTIKTSAESFTTSLEKNQFSMREYFRYAGGATKTFGSLFKTEFDTISKVAEDRVKRLQTQYIKMGRDASGQMRAIAVMPTELNMNDAGTKLQLAAQKQAIFNQLVQQGSTNLLNFGKNTQWAGRQLMVGFTLPLMAFGSAASQAFMQMEQAAIKFQKVYGDLGTTPAEAQQQLAAIQELAKGYTQYGIAASTTVALAADAAAAGFQGLDLQRQTAEATRLSVLGQIDSQQALQTTITLQNAFNIQSKDLAQTIDFLNAVENQTVTSLDDITIAIPKVAPVINQLGGNVKDLAFFLTAMKQGGVNASEGANALKSGLASLINPTRKASEMFASVGININDIVKSNKGDLKATVIGFAQALDTLDPLSRARAIETMFGKFQFARMSTLLANVTQQGTQAARVMDLANSSAEDLANLSQKELGITSESAMMKFKKSVEDLKVALIPVGETFLQAVTPIVSFVGGILDRFNNLSDGTKKFITLLTVGIGAAGPVLLMTFGLLANGIANIIKLFLTLRGGYDRLSGGSKILGEQTQYLTTEQLDAAAVAHSLDQSHARLIQTFNVEAESLKALTGVYQSAAAAAQKFAINNPGAMVPPKFAKKYANGVSVVPGSGSGDTVPAMLTPGEAVIPKEMTARYAPLINGMIAGNIPGYARGKGAFEGSVFGTAGIFSRRSTAQDIEATIAKLDAAIQELVINAVPSIVESLKGASISVESFGQEVQRRAKEGTIAVPRSALGAFGEKSYSAPANIAKQTQSMDWASRAKEEAAIDEALKKYVLTLEQRNNLIGKDTAHIEQSIATSATGEKIWDPSNLQADSRALNKYMEQAKSRMLEFANETDKLDALVSQVAKDLNISAEAVRARFARLTKGNQPQNATDYSLIGGFAAQDINNPKNRAPYMAAAAKAVTDVRANDTSYVEALALGDVTAYKATVKKNSQDMYVASRDRKSPHPLAPKDGADDGRAYTQAAEASARRSRRVTTGVITPEGPNPFVTQMMIAEQTQKTGSHFEELKTKLQGTSTAVSKIGQHFTSATFALTALGGAASMAGGKLGSLGAAVSQISGVLFGISAVKNLLEGTKVASVLGRYAAAYPPLLAVIGLTVGVIKLSNYFRDKETKAIEGFGNAITLTKDKINVLAGLLATTATPRAGSLATVSAIQRSMTQAGEIADIKKSPDFQKTFKDDIAEFKKATSAEAMIAFKALALDLSGQGFAKDAIDKYIQAIAEESGKSKVYLKFAQIDLSSKTASQDVDKLVDQIISPFNKKVKNKIQEETKGYANNYVVMQKPTQEQNKILSTTSKELSNVVTSLTSAFGKQTLTAEQYRLQMSSVFAKIGQGKDSLGLLQSTLKAISPEYAKNTTGIKDYGAMLSILQAALLNVNINQQLFNDLLSDNPAKVEAAKKKIAELAAITEAAGKNLKPDTSGLTLPDSTTKQTNALKDQVTQIKNQTEAYIKLRKANIDNKMAIEISNNSEMAKQLANAKTTSQLKVLIGLVQQYEKAQKKLAELQATPVDKNLDRLTKLQNQATLYERIIDAQSAPRIKAYNDQLAVQESALRKINDQINAITKAQINPLQKQIDLNNYALEGIALKEDAINKTYDMQIAALEKVASINQDIANIQKQRMTIADALTRGDISAAASAVQDARAQQASTAIQNQRTGLTSAKDNQIAALGRVALEQQNKELQYQIATIQQTQLVTLEEQKISLESQIQSTQQMLADFQASVQAQKESAMYSGMTKTEIETSIGLIQAGQPFADQYAKILGNSASSAKSMADALWSAVSAQIALNNAKAASKGGFSLSSLRMSKGGMVPQYLATGGYAVGTDTVPAMLTPGEFVVNKSAAQAYKPLLQSINASQYPSMLNTSPGVNMAVVSQSNMTSDSSTAVYNYNLGFNINGNSSNPQDIARAVMTQIKQVDSQRLRSKSI